jgi:hypothetical protein
MAMNQQKMGNGGEAGISMEERATKDFPRRLEVTAKNI